MNDLLFSPVESICFAFAWLKWALGGPYRLGDATLGDGWIRDQNRKLLREKWKAREPRREDYGLRP